MEILRKKKYKSNNNIDNNNFELFENLIDKTINKMENSLKEPIKNLKDSMEKVNTLENKIEKINQSNTKPLLTTNPNTNIQIN